MKKLDQYIIRELFVPFLIGTLAVVMMFQANLLIFQYKTFSFNTIPILASLQLVLFETPGFLSMTLPVGTSLAVSLAVTRLARETELTAMRGAGASIRRVVRPMMIFGIGVSVLNFAISEFVMPPAKRASIRLQRDIQLLGATPDFKSNVVVNLQNFTVFVALVQRGKNGEILLNNVTMVERPRQDETWFYRADKGVYKDGVWGGFTNLKLWTFKGEKADYILPQTFSISEKISLESMFAPPSIEERTVSQLIADIRNYRKGGVDTRPIEVNLHTRFSVPAACLVFAAVAPIFAVLFARGGSFMGILLSLFLVMAYYNLYIISTEILGKQGIVPPFIAAWLPNLLFIFLGLIALRRIE